MRKTAFILLFLIPMVAAAQTFDSVVDFEPDISTFIDEESVQRALDDGRVVILEGLVRDVVMDSDPVVTTILLVNGEWIGTTEIRAYSCRVTFTGALWQSYFSTVSEGTTAAASAGSRLLVAARITGYDSGNRLSVAEGIALRVLR